MGIQVSNNLQPNQIEAFSSFLVLTSSIILGNVAFTRLKEMENSQLKFSHTFPTKVSDNSSFG
ncbi:hypothetical protein [Clostridium pasteurianum]|uniref:hypothetical protein n=1 Tax=Clostridium pasteurianum TaxID=1501 RepID=UPI0003AA40FC|nr:hypothetical protein [Clostridium pasteurianum]